VDVRKHLAALPFFGNMAAMKKHKSADSLRPFSSVLLDGDERAAAREVIADSIETVVGCGGMDG
jgi:hypothetical protein